MVTIAYVEQFIRSWIAIYGNIPNVLNLINSLIKNDSSGNDFMGLCIINAHALLNVDENQDGFDILFDVAFDEKTNEQIMLHKGKPGQAVIEKFRKIRSLKKQLMIHTGRVAWPFDDDTEDYAPLINACIHGDKTLVKRLLDQGADSNIRCKNGITPLAQSAGNSEIMSLLLSKGANPNTQIEANDATPLMRTICSESYIESFVNVSSLFSSALSIFKTPSCLAVVELLLDHDAEVDTQNYQGNTALNMAIVLEYKYVVEKLIEKGADVNKENKIKATPLFYAVISGNNIAITELLLQHKANPNHAMHDGTTPLHIVQSMFPRGDSKMEQLLRKYGALDILSS